MQESWPVASVGDHIANVIQNQAFDYLDAPVEVISALDLPLPYAVNLESKSLPQTDDVVKAIKKVCYLS